MEKKMDVFEVIASKDTLHIRFSSFLEYIDEVCKTVTRFLKSDQEELASHLFAIHLVLREGLTNAVRHGNKNDPDKLVEFQLKINRGKSICIEIADQGEGFDWKKQQLSGLPEDEDHGRGMAIMETYFTRYSYNQRGNRLYLEKKIFS
ncbi:MAG: ATP-binding protein [Deltaproteobacteria bacterium]|nr:MAG: ATP-binding protein [Deltaproteobacteria bacterium]